MAPDDSIYVATDQGWVQHFSVDSLLLAEWRVCSSTCPSGLTGIDLTSAIPGASLVVQEAGAGTQFHLYASDGTGHQLVDAGEPLAGQSPSVVRSWCDGACAMHPTGTMHLERYGQMAVDTAGTIWFGGEVCTDWYEAIGPGSGIWECMVDRFAMIGLGADGRHVAHHAFDVSNDLRPGGTYVDDSVAAVAVNLPGTETAVFERGHGGKWMVNAAGQVLVSDAIGQRASSTVALDSSNHLWVSWSPPFDPDVITANRVYDAAGTELASFDQHDPAWSGSRAGESGGGRAISVGAANRMVMADHTYRCCGSEHVVVLAPPSSTVPTLRIENAAGVPVDYLISWGEAPGYVGYAGEEYDLRYPDPGNVPGADFHVPVGAVQVVAQGFGVQEVVLQRGVTTVVHFPASATGSLSGVVLREGGLAVAGARVAVRMGDFVRTTETGADGSYAFAGMPVGTFFLWVYPAEADLVPGVRIVGVGADTVEDVVLSKQAAAPVSIGSCTLSTGGRCSVPSSRSSTISALGCLPGRVASFHLQSAVRAVDLPSNEPIPGVYVATFTPVLGEQLIMGELLVEGCPSVPFQFYIDPSGTVRAPGGTPIEGVTVTLLRSDSPDGPFDVIADGSTLMSASNRVNPWVTGTDGEFGWDVVPGFYKVRAQKQGCTDPVDGAKSSVETGVLPVAPAWLDLDLRLSCPSGPIGSWYHAVSPARILDSRPPPEQVGPFGTPWGAGMSREVTVAGVGGVPADAEAVVLNVTVTGTSAPSFLSVWPAGQPQPSPLVSSLNWSAGSTIPNAVTAKVGANGKVTVYNSSGSVHVIIDVVGFYRANSGKQFFTVNPSRVLDSRPPPEQVGAFGTPWGPATSRSITVTGIADIPLDAAAVVANATVTSTSAPSFLSFWAGGAATPSPLVSSLNWSPGVTIPNAVTLICGSGPDAGRVQVYNSAGSVHVIVDALGYFR